MILKSVSYAPIIDYPGTLYYKLAAFLSEVGQSTLFGWSICMLVLIGLMTYIACSKALSYLNPFASLRFLDSRSFFILLFTITIFLGRLPNVIHPELNPDESQWIINAATLAHDPRFWISTDAFTGGPLLVYPLNLINLAGGSLNYVSIRLFALIFCLIPSAILLYYAFVNFYDEKIAGVIILPFVTCIALMNYWDFLAYNSEHVPTLLLALSIYLYSKINKYQKRVHVFFLGLVLGMLPYAKLQAVPIGLFFAYFHLTCIYFEYERMKKFLNEAAIFVLGGFLPSALVLVYLLTYDAFDSFYELYVLNNLVYADKGLSTVEETRYLYITLIRTHEYLMSILDTKLFFEVPLIAFLVTPVFLVLLRKNVAYNNIKLIALSYLLMFGCLYGIMKPYTFFPHYQILLLSPALFFIGTITGSAYHHINLISECTIKKRIIASVLLIYLFQPVILRTFYAFFEGNRGLLNITNSDATVVNKTEVANTILSHARPGERMAVWGWAHKLYVETGLIQGTVQPSSYYQLVKSSIQSEYIHKYIHDLMANKPKVFVDAVGSQSIIFNDTTLFRHNNFPMIAKYIAINYNFVGEVNDVRVYIRKN